MYSELIENFIICIGMKKSYFLTKLQRKLYTFEKAISTKEKEWIIKGFIDIYKNIYTISIDTKIITKVLELLLFPLLQNFAKEKNRNSVVEALVLNYEGVPIMEHKKIMQPALFSEFEIEFA